MDVHFIGNKLQIIGDYLLFTVLNYIINSSVFGIINVLFLLNNIFKYSDTYICVFMKHL